MTSAIVSDRPPLSRRACGLAWYCSERTALSIFSAVCCGSAIDPLRQRDTAVGDTPALSDKIGRTIGTVEKANTADLSTKISWSLLDRIVGLSEPATTA